MRFYLIAGEPSGDALGAALMAGLNSLNPDIQFTGVGGPLMQAQGLESQFPMEELSVMGLAEVLPKYTHLKRRIRECAESVLADPPDALITIDSPDFSLRVARLVKSSADIRTIHYVAPTVWAWRAKRAAKMAQVIDHVLALFPFEPPYMEAEGMRCDFVGHPVVAQPQASEADVAALRAAYGMVEDDRILLVLPGSRVGEVSRLAGTFGQALKRVLNDLPDLKVVLPAAGPVADRIEQLTRDWTANPIILDPRGKDPEAFATEKRAAFRAAEVALAASGTVSLELAAAQTPMVIAYDMNWITRQIISRMLQIDTVTLVNIVSETRAVPEFLGDACTPEAISTGLLDLLQSDTAMAAQLSAEAETMLRLGQGGEDPGLRAAKAVLDGLPTIDQLA